MANYMAEEIKNNIELKNTEDMAKNNKVIKTFKWYNSVRSDEEWDHKWQLSALFPSMGLSRRFYHMYNDKEIPYDVWANIHFGVIGKKINTSILWSDNKFSILNKIFNKSEFILLKGAGLAQTYSDMLKLFFKGEFCDGIVRYKDIMAFGGNYGDNAGDVEAIKIGFQVAKDYNKKTFEDVTNQMLTILQTYSRTK